MPSLAEKLGYQNDSRLLIVTCDNLGMCHSANVAVYESLRSGLATTASLMVPAPWAREAVSGYRGSDVGVHLTLNAEHQAYRWGPITQAPSLLDGMGGFPTTVEDLWDHADLDETRRECRAQIERAIFWGFDVSHLDSHLDAMAQRPEFFDVYLDMAVDFGLPVRLDDATHERNVGFAFRRLAEDEGIVSPDRVNRMRTLDRRDALETALSSLEPGVTELILQPASDTPEIRALTAEWPSRVEDYALLNQDLAIRELIERSGTVLIGYEQLRTVQRAGA